MATLNFVDSFVTFLALLGPQKILLSFDEASRGLRARQAHVLAVTSSAAAAAVGVLCALTAPWLTSFFHISYPAVQLAGGATFFLYALTLLFGLHLTTEMIHQQPAGDPAHPVAHGFRALVLPPQPDECPIQLPIAS
jgi:multiple antibiotic resistance protein